MISRCAECGTELKDVVLGQVERRGQSVGLVIFEDVPARECPRCGEQYFSAQVSEQMETVLRGQVPPTGKTSVATFSLKASGPAA